jgi:hypothetical protein
MNVEIPKEEIEKVARALMPPLDKRAKFFEKVWQSLIAYAQFGNRDFINAMIKYVRTSDQTDKLGYFAEAKIHISDAFCQLFLLCIFYDVDVNEVIKLGVERLKNHWQQEMLKEFKEYYE